jgi:hypothetical protein
MPVPSTRKIFAGLAAMLPLAAAMVMTSASPAMAASCYDHTGNVSGTYSKTGLDQRVPASGNLTTTSYCGDINLYIGADSVSPNYPYLMACVVFTAHGTACSNGYVPAGPGWQVIASDVRDGSAFIVKLRGLENDPESRGTAFKLAF